MHFLQLNEEVLLKKLQKLRPSQISWRHQLGDSIRRCSDVFFQHEGNARLFGFLTAIVLLSSLFVAFNLLIIEHPFSSHHPVLMGMLFLCVTWWITLGIGMYCEGRGELHAHNLGRIDQLLQPYPLLQKEVATWFLEGRRLRDAHYPKMKAMIEQYEARLKKETEMREVWEKSHLSRISEQLKLQQQLPVAEGKRNSKRL